MTQEEQTQLVLESLPHFVMAGPDQNGKVLYGCITTRGKSSYVVEENQIFHGHPGEGANEEQMEAWRHQIAIRVGKLRGALLWNCLGALTTEEMKKDSRVGEFIWRTLHNNPNAATVSVEEFLELFKANPEACVEKSSVASPEAT